MNRHILVLTLALGLAMGAAGTADAQGFESIRLGDMDGFGFGLGAGLLNFQGDPVNVDSVDVLGPGPPFADFLPDLDQDGLVQDFQGDDFDNRTAPEITGTSLGGSGYTDSGSNGSQFTDVSLSRSYDTTFPVPNDFPAPPSIDRNDTHLEFRFFVATGDITPGAPIFLNVVFGDIGAIAGELRVSYASAAPIDEVIAPINPNVEDGLIRAAFLELPFFDVFTGTSGGWTGHVDVDIVTRPGTVDGDPFYALDYAELSTSQVTNVGGATPRLLDDRLRIAPSVFGARTVIHYLLPENVPGTIEVFDIRGSRVQTFAVSGVQGSVVWDGTSRRGNRVASGVYFVRLRSRDWSTTRRAVLTR